MVKPEVALFSCFSLKEITWQSHAFSGVGEVFGISLICLFIFSQTPTSRFRVRND
jgi:hypothetical protein